jgi:hypothetical protein
MRAPIEAQYLRLGPCVLCPSSAIQSLPILSRTPRRVNVLALHQSNTLSSSLTLSIHQQIDVINMLPHPREIHSKTYVQATSVNSTAQASNQLADPPDVRFGCSHCLIDLPCRVGCFGMNCVTRQLHPPRLLHRLVFFRGL